VGPRRVVSPSAPAAGALKMAESTAETGGEMGTDDGQRTRDALAKLKAGGCDRSVTLDPREAVLLAILIEELQDAFAGHSPYLPLRRSDTPGFDALDLACFRAAAREDFAWEHYQRRLHTYGPRAGRCFHCSGSISGEHVICWTCALDDVEIPAGTESLARFERRTAEAALLAEVGGDKFTEADLFGRMGE
jgi:hypothetical protein